MSLTFPQNPNIPQISKHSLRLNNFWKHISPADFTWSEAEPQRLKKKAIVHPRGGKKEEEVF